MLINGGKKMAKKTIESKSSDIEVLAEKLGIKKENLEFGLKEDKAKTEDGIMKAAKFMGMV